VKAGSVGAWLLPFLVIVYLGLNDGGYGAIERSEVGILVSWTLLVAAAVGVLVFAGGTVAGRIALGLFALFVVWTALSLLWTGSAEQTFTSIGRVVTYAALFALALGIQRNDRWRYMLYGVTAAAVVICAVGVLSSLEPSWFTVPNVGKLLPGIKNRLAYPLNYTSGMGGFAAITLPLLLGMTASARTVLVQALAAAALPVAALALWLTTSSLSVPVATVSVLVFLGLTHDRIPKLGTVLVAACGSAILFAAVADRHAFNQGVKGPLAVSQGHEVLAILIVVCVGVGLVQAAISLAVRYTRRPSWLLVSRRHAQRALTGVLVVGAIALIALVASGKVSDAWNHFRSGGTHKPGESRGSLILDYGSNGRYAYWRSAAKANEAHPVDGIGAGTFEFWWAQHGDGTTVRNAHSLYLESLAELGIIGFVLIGGFSVLIVGVGGTRALRAPPELRTGLATATAACAGFVLAAAVDWMWQLAVLPAVFLCLAAIVLAGGRSEDSERRSVRSRRISVGGRVALAAFAVASLIVNGILLASNQDVQRSHTAVRAGDLPAALSDARDAESTQPYAAAPHLQEALVLEQMGRFNAAVTQAEDAARNEPPNWQNWLVLSRLEVRAGRPQAALADYRTAKSLNPRSSIFDQ
jgi:O-antigen ligase